MSQSYISIGSNIDPANNVRSALRLLADQVPVKAVSTVYLSDAVDRPEQAQFYNLVVEVRVDVPPSELKDILRGIEDRLHRLRSRDKYGPRTIDLDIIVYSDELVDPDVPERPFLSVPLFELAPEFVIPGVGPLKEIVAEHANHNMKPLPAYTAALRKDLEDGPRKSSATRERTAD